MAGGGVGSTAAAGRTRQVQLRNGKTGRDWIVGFGIGRRPPDIGGCTL